MALALLCFDYSWICCWNAVLFCAIHPEFLACSRPYNFIGPTNGSLHRYSMYVHIYIHRSASEKSHLLIVLKSQIQCSITMLHGQVQRWNWKVNWPNTWPWDLWRYWLICHTILSDRNTYIGFGTTRTQIFVSSYGTLKLIVFHSFILSYSVHFFLGTVDRHYWVPWNSYYFHLCFAASFQFWFHSVRNWVEKRKNLGKWEAGSM